jgi:hypothetical protein
MNVLLLARRPGADRKQLLTYEVRSVRTTIFVAVGEEGLRAPSPISMRLGLTFPGKVKRKCLSGVAPGP